jgi:hypothetical protein
MAPAPNGDAGEVIPSMDGPGWASSHRAVRGGREAPRRRFPGPETLRLERGDAA